MKDVFLIIMAIIILSIIALTMIFHFRKKSIIRRVSSMTLQEKNEILDSLAQHGGYSYEARQDIFSTTPYAPQKLFGYNTFYDLSAPFFNMVFDYETIYFDYNSRTWLIQMWKGQYGINAGCELGIYVADEIIPPDKYDNTHFNAVDAADWLDIGLELNQITGDKHSSYKQLGHTTSRHWWLTIFKPGTFAQPQNLFVNTAIRFKNFYMMRSFLESFETTIPEINYHVNGLTVYFTFCQSNRQYSIFRQLVRRLALISCSLWCKWFNWVTRPFSGSGDKILYLYYYLPFIIRNLFKPKKTKR